MIKDSGLADLEAALECLNTSPTRWAEYVKFLKSAIRYGNATAQEHLGAWYLEGIKTSDGQTVLRRSPRRAVALLTQAASAGSRPAMFRLACCYHDGEGVSRDHALAARWYRRAYRMGDSTAAWNLAILYRQSGRKRLSDEWFWRAADGGEPAAIVEVARLTQSRRWSKERATKAFSRVRKLARAERDPESGEAKELLTKLAGGRQQRGR